MSEANLANSQQTVFLFVFRFSLRPNDPVCCGHLRRAVSFTNGGDKHLDSLKHY